jgi:tripartite ATP-independent transporter DctM subunit
MMALIILPVVFTLLLLYGVPVSFCIGTATVLTLFNFMPDVTTVFVISAQRMASSLDSFTLVAIPLFILAGSMMNTGGIALRLIEFAKVIVGWLPGSLAHITCVANALFGAISGSAVASAAAVGSTMAPLQRKEGYDMPFCAAVNTISSPSGLLIPPSGALIVYSLISGGTPVDVLFVAGYVPGMLMAVLAMTWIGLKASRGELPTSVQRYSASEATRITLRAIPALLLIVIVMGGIIGGIFTATEAAGIAALYTFVLGRFFYKTLDGRTLLKATLDASVGTAVVMTMVGVSMTMAWLLASTGAARMLSDSIIGFSDNPYVLMLLFNVLLLIFGTFLDITPNLLIFTPIFLPVALQLGISPVHFGIIIVYNLCIGITTPPVGSTLFVSSRVTGVPLGQMTRPMLPLFALQIAGLLAVTYLPALSLWLPGVVLGKVG